MENISVSSKVTYTTCAKNVLEVNCIICILHSDFFSISYPVTQFILKYQFNDNIQLSASHYFYKCICVCVCRHMDKDRQLNTGSNETQTPTHTDTL